MNGYVWMVCNIIHTENSYDMLLLSSEYVHLHGNFSIDILVTFMYKTVLEETGS